MINSFSFIVISIFYILILGFTFFKKEHIQTPELKLYGYLLITNFIGLFLEMMCYILIKFFPVNFILSIIFNKIYLVHFIAFTTLFLDYVISISIGNDKYEQKRKKIFTFSLISFLFFGLLSLLLPIHLHCGTKIYSYGPAVNLIYIYASFCMIFYIIEMFRHIKTVKTKKYIPLIVYIFGCGIVAVIQKIHPDITLSTSMDAIILYIMYHTIENPDLKMLNELELAKKNAERANNAKTEFLSSMSHEIRTPLNAIVGFSNSIMEDKTLQEAKEEAKDIIMASNNLLEIVNGILDISKIEAGKMEIVNVNYNLNNMFNDLVKLIKPRIGDKPIELTTNFSSDIPGTLYGDAGKVREVILNLLTNACKYTEEGTIDFSVNCINEKNFSKLVISVEDTGRGIKADKIDKLFTKFNRLEEDRNTTLEGTGLGLAITKNLVEMMGGKIIVQSKYGSGSKFTIFIKQKIISLEDTTPKTPVSDNDTIDYSNKKILVVDDNNLNIKVACRMLKNYNIIPDTCISGFECLEKIKDNTYDLILLDDMMPKLSGIETLKKLKEDKTFKTPVVILTANAVSGMKEKYLKAGFNDYLAKPIDKLELRRVLNNYLQKGGQK